MRRSAYEQKGTFDPGVAERLNILSHEHDILPHYGTFERIKAEWTHFLWKKLMVVNAEFQGGFPEEKYVWTIILAPKNEGNGFDSDSRWKNYHGLTLLEALVNAAEEVFVRGKEPIDD